MRSRILGIIIFLVMLSSPAWAAEAAEAAESMDIPAIVGQGAVMIMKVIGVPLALLIALLVTKLLKKVGIEVDAESKKFIAKQADSAIRKVDAWAAKLANEGKKPKDHEKLARGLDLLEGIIKVSKIDNMARDKLTEIIEERLVAQKEKGRHTRVKEADPKANPTT